MAKRRAPSTAFKKGHPKVGGRKKGTPNKFTTDVKQAILLAFKDLGGSDWLKTLAKRDRRSFAQLIGRLIPSQTQLSGKDGGPIGVLVERAQGNLSKLDDKELAQLTELMTKAGLLQVTASETEAQ